MVPFKCLCRPPPASGAPRAALYPVAETMAGFRGAAPKGWQPRVGRTCVCYGARVPTPPGSSVSWSLNLPGGIRRNPAAARRPTLPCRQCGGERRVPGGRAHVGLLWVPRSRSGGETRAAPLPGQKHRHPRPKGGRPAAKVTGHPLGAPGGLRSTSLPSPSTHRPYASLLPRVAPRAALWPTAPLLTLRAGGAEAAAAPPAHTPAGRQLALC